MDTSSNTDGDPQEQADLFSLPDASGADAPANPVPEQPQEPAPETLPMIPGGTPQVLDRIESDRAPLIFTDRAPIPTRNGEQEEIGSSYRRRHEQAQTPVEFDPLTPDRIPEDVSLGTLLKLARENIGYDLDHVKAVTRISLNYLIALEEDATDRFPQQVYVFAYTRTLCDLYRLPEELKKRAIELLNGYFHNKLDISQKVLERVSQESVVNHEEEQRVRRIFTVASIVIGIVCLLGIWAVIALVIRSNAGEQENTQEQTVVQKEKEDTTSASKISEAELPAKQASSSFDAKQLESLNASQICNLYTLEISRTPTVIRK